MKWIVLVMLLLFVGCSYNVDVNVEKNPNMENICKDKCNNQLTLQVKEDLQRCFAIGSSICSEREQLNIKNTESYKIESDFDSSCSCKITYTSTEPYKIVNQYAGAADGNLTFVKKDILK
jgi:hypothetical protein